MASPIPPCSHELRPGTAVCLRCQHAERGIKRAKQRQMMARGGAAALSLAIIAAVGVAAATALRSRSGAAPAPPVQMASADTAPTADQNVSDSVATPQDAPGGAVATLASAPGPSGAGSAMAATPTPSGTPIVTARQVALVVPVGRSELRDTMIAERAGDTVRVSFDLLLSRTRRPDKFEAIVRSTLPQVYGASVDSALRALPVGAVARAGDLVTTLPERGFHIPLTDGRSIGVWPVTRAGRDGPLVVAYRAVASR